MSPSDKAKELVNKYWNLPTTFNYVIDGVVFVDNSHINYKTAKQCALVAVEEILDVTKRPTYNQNNWNEITGFKYDKFWEQVKHEIEKL